MGTPKPGSSHESGLLLGKMDVIPAFLSQWGKKHTDEVSTLTRDSKHTLSPLYFYSSNKQTELITEIWNACQGLMFNIKVVYSLAPRKQWFRTTVNLKRKWESASSFMLLFVLCSCHCYNPVLRLAATPTRVKIFIPSVHLKSDIQKIFSSRLTYYSKESGTMENIPIILASHNSQHYIA